MASRIAMSYQHEQTEKEWDALLFASKKGLASTLGWRLVYHTLRSKGSRAGFPDRVLVRERVVFAELKSAKGRLSADQVEWLDGLSIAGAECYVWSPPDLDEIGLVLGKRWKFDPVTHSLERKEMFLLPKSIWIPGRGRRDAGAGANDVVVTNGEPVVIENDALF